MSGRPAPASAADALCARSREAPYPESPVMWAIRVRPHATRCSMASRPALTLSQMIERCVREDHRHGQVAAQRRPGVGPAAHHDQPVDLAAEQRL